MALKVLVGDLVWRITGDSTDYNKKVKASEKSGQALLSTMTRVGSLVGGVLFGKKLITAASNAEETINKFNVTFKGIGDAANAAASNLSDSFGLSSQKSQQLLSDTADLLQGFGLTKGSSLDLSTAVNELAVNLASFTNYEGGAEGASAALTKALLGEREQVKSLGIALTETELKKFAADQGLVWDQLDRGQKAWITYKMAVKQSQNAIGDFARSEGSFANQTRIMEANLQDFMVTLGQQLLPLATQIVAKISELIKWFGGLDDSAKKLILAITGIVTIGPSVISAISGIKVAVVALSGALSGPVGLIVLLGGATIALLKFAKAKADASKTEEFEQFSDDLKKIASEANLTAIQFHDMIDMIATSFTGVYTAADAVEQTKIAAEAMEIPFTAVAKIIEEQNILQGEMLEAVKAQADIENQREKILAIASTRTQDMASYTERRREEEEKILALMEDQQKIRLKGENDYKSITDGLKGQLEAIGETAEAYKQLSLEYDKGAEKASAVQGALDDLIAQGYKAENLNIQTLIATYGDLITIQEEASGSLSEEFKERLAIRAEEENIEQLTLQALEDKKQREQEYHDQYIAHIQEELSYYSIYAGSVGTIFTNLISSMTAGDEELTASKKKNLMTLYRWQQAANIAQIAIDTASSIVRQYKDLPIYLAIPASIITAAVGITQAAVVASTKPSFQEGGVVPGVSYSGDNIPIYANSKEMVITTEQQKELFDIANGKSSQVTQESSLGGSSGVGVVNLTVQIGSEKLYGPIQIALDNRLIIVKESSVIKGK